MIPLLCIGVLLLVVAGLMFSRLRNDTNDGDMGEALLCVLFTVLGAALLAIALAVWLYRHVHLGVT